jgi:hypothetical protein
MRFLLLVAEADPGLWARAGHAERTALREAHAEFDAAVRQRGRLLAGEALEGAAAARTLRTVAGRRVVTEGPYAETVEQLGGFYLVELDSRDAAAELAAVLPDQYTVEIRPAVMIEGHDHGDRG